MSQSTAAHREYMRRRRALMRAQLPAPVEPEVLRLRARIAELEAEVARLRAVPEPSSTAPIAPPARQASIDAVLRRVNTR